uniref:Major facilitator superfamily (MFS) profile domain-containing protein n=1 Tax=Panagrolaimus sp. JU765 TaxID=591449 RepID=A0AC34R2V3_9BILA
MTEEFVNGTHVEVFDQNEKGALYSALAVGTLISCLLIMKLIRKFGGRLTFLSYGLISGIATMFFPIGTNYGIVPAVFLRAMQGIGNGMPFASIGYVSAAWCPLKASGVFLTALTAYNQLAPLMTMPLAGYFCTSSFGWKGIYYLQGFLTIIVFIFFYSVYKDQPRFHQRVSDKELVMIEHKKSVMSVDGKCSLPPVPYMEIIKDPSTIGTLFICFGDFFCFNIFVLFAPIYLNKVLGLNIADTGIASAFPYLGSLVLKTFVGPFSDGLTSISTLTSVRLFMTLSQFPMTLALITLAIIPPTWIFVAQLSYFCAIVFSAFGAVGYYKSVQLSAGPFSSVIMSWASIIYSIIILVLPIFKTIVAGDDQPDQWRLIFVVAAAISFVTLGIWLFTVKVDLRPWAIIESTNSWKNSSLTKENLTNKIVPKIVIEKDSKLENVEI